MRLGVDIGGTKIELALLDDARDPTMLAIRGDAQFALGDRAKAREAYAKALGLVDVGDPQHRLLQLKLIEAGDRRGLLERSLQTLIEKNPDMRPAEGELRNHIAQFHCKFYVSQTGHALPVV